MKRIEFEITDEQYAALCAIAQQRGALAWQVARGAAISLAREWSRPLIRAFAERHAAGLSDRELAEEFGITRSRVSYLRGVIKVPANPPAHVVYPQSPRSRKVTR